MNDKEITKLANHQEAAIRINRDFYIKQNKTPKKEIVLISKKYPQESFKFSKNELKYLITLLNDCKSKKCKQQGNADGLS